MPSASTSIFSMPRMSRSSLSHSITVRSSIAAFSIGTTSDSLPRVMTKPPVCCDRWREADQFAGQLQCPPQVGLVRVEARLAYILLLDPLAAPAPQRLRQYADRILRQAHRLADIADRALGA